ncbi:UNVERIFIED_CONTAM: hypothetical protein Sangu_2731400 [Sesamum angustifolium]|uniref:Uncharacterized protein n=1 Tax=Sesamum angustifolium TaxID=2727405 RepID=A0AAW2IWD1_9LAMI
MSLVCGSFRLDESSSLRRIGRSSSSLVASELVTSEIARITAYEKLSQSLRVTAEESPSTNERKQRCRRNKAWTSLVKLFSHKKVENNRNVKHRRVTVATVAEPPRVVVAGDTKKSRTCWLPDPHRRWPVQGW